MALGKEPKSSNDDLQAITTLLTLILEKSSKIDDLEKIIKAIDFKPQTTVSLNRELLSNEIAEKLKFQGVRINDKKTFIQIFREDWKKYTAIIVLSVSLFLSLSVSFYFLLENKKLKKENTYYIHEYNYFKDKVQAQENQETKSKKSKK